MYITTINTKLKIIGAAAAAANLLYEFKITDNDNVQLATYDDSLSNPDGTRYAMYEFIINTEPNDSTPEEIVENLKFIFSQK